MKYLNLLLTVLLLGLLGCSGDTLSGVQLDDQAVDTETVAAKNGRNNGTVTVPFEAYIVTEGLPTPPDYGRPTCGDRPAPPDGPWVETIMGGYGQATHLGRFTIQGTFCSDIAAFLDDGVFTEGETMPYDNGTATFTAANGDELIVAAIEGEIVWHPDPDIFGTFSGTFEFVGGTGRFEGASGNGMYDSIDYGNEQEHDWSGSLVLPRGK